MLATDYIDQPSFTCWNCLCQTLLISPHLPVGSSVKQLDYYQMISHCFLTVPGKVLTLLILQCQKIMFLYFIFYWYLLVSGFWRKRKKNCCLLFSTSVWLLKDYKSLFLLFSVFHAPLKEVILEKRKKKTNMFIPLYHVNHTNWCRLDSQVLLAVSAFAHPAILTPLDFN